MEQPWIWLLDEAQCWVGHVVSTELVEDLKADLLKRSIGKSKQPAFKPSDIKEPAHFDMPGMVLQNRTLRHVKVDGLDIEVPSQDWTSILFDFRLCKKRTFESGRDYYKIHGWRYCIVLTPEQREAVIKNMEEQQKDADAESDADDKILLERIEQANNEAGKTLVFSARVEAIKSDRKNSN